MDSTNPVDEDSTALTSMLSAEKTPVSFTLGSRCVEILNTPSMTEKCRLTRQLAEDWSHGTVDLGASAEVPKRPARTKEGLRGRVKQPQSAKHFLHHLAHAEGCAVDCFIDLLARFDVPAPAFVDDMLRIAVDETRHFESLVERLEAHGLRYGDLDVHDSLTSSMEDTSDSLLARLAIVHLCHEARGLDVFHLGKARLERAQDLDSVAVLDTNYSDEIIHVRDALKWFKIVADNENLDPRQAFIDIVRNPRRWRAQALKPPFNHEARSSAGFTPDWYLPLASPPPPEDSHS